MLAASIHEHAGLGNQIWRYVCCRVFAEHLGYEWGVSHPGWRGPFLNIDWGKEVDYNDDDLINPADFVPTEKFKTYYQGHQYHQVLSYGVPTSPYSNA